MNELSIQIAVSNADLARMLAAFARRFRKPDLTVDEMLAGLKANAIAQINTVVTNEEKNAIEELKNEVTPLALT